MADYSIFIPFIIFIVVAFVAFKILSGIIKFAVLIFAVAIALLAVFGFFVMMDAQQFIKGMENEASLFIFSDNDEAIIGLSVSKDNDSMLVSHEKLEEYTESLGDKDYAAMKGDYFKLVIINSRVLQENGTESPEVAEGIREAATPEEKLSIFLNALENAFSDPIVLLREYKEGNIIIYEETLMFKTFKFMPTATINSFADKFLKPLKLYESVSVSESQINSWIQSVG